MRYFLRLNGDPELQIEVEHTIESDDTEVKIKDGATFPAGMLPDRTRIEKVEMLDEAGELWAMRRIPEDYAPVIYNCVSYSFNWTLRITKEVT